MTFDEYQKKSRLTAVYPDILGKGFVYPVLGLCGEAGEVAEKIKKIFRDRRGKMSNEQKQDLAKEFGDVLWYLAQLATECGLSFDHIAEQNLKKLFSRKERGVIHGSGDHR